MYKAQCLESETPEHLNIKVTDNNNEVFFKIKRSTKLEKLMTAFCERQGKSLQSVRFLFEGQRVQATDTPDTLEMADGDCLEVHQEQPGELGDTQRVRGWTDRGTDMATCFLRVVVRGRHISGDEYESIDMFCGVCMLSPLRPPCARRAPAVLPAWDADTFSPSPKFFRWW
ncbi:hypothetical protein P8C59_004211 [Phyllachora maydis]|uniref:Ubiquitin-like domain-containing protein n=1 Tax=Phyllachora maydis TaxID=1825666 RepID=A0AAD9I2Y4_9PEZI|nr:hypothetical protein P8C59_004211 [Phyllachora maydis]